MVRVVAKNFTKKDKISELTDLLKSLKEHSLKEEGCIKYEIYQDEEDKTVLTLIQEWEELVYLDKHYESEYFMEMADEITGLLRKETEINIYNLIG